MSKIIFVFSLLSLHAAAQTPAKNPNADRFRDEEIHLTAIQFDSAVQDDCKKLGAKTDPTKFTKVWAAAKPELKIVTKGPLKHDPATHSCALEFSISKAGVTKNYRMPMTDKDKFGDMAEQIKKAREKAGAK